MNKILIAVTIVTIMSGCTWSPAKLDYTELSDNQYESRNEDHKITIYRTTLPEDNYEELGIAIVNGGSFQTVGTTLTNSYKKAIDLLKEQAREKGGDAVIDIREGSTTGNARVTLTATIIRWK